MAGDEGVDLYRMVEQWGQEFAIERELTELRTPEDAGWLSLAEAEKRVGVSRSTLRAWYRGGQIASRLMPGPHGLQRLVPLDAVIERAARSPRTGPRAQASTGGSSGAAAGAGGADAVVRLAEIATAAATERALAAEGRAAEAEAALHVALERAAAAEAEVRLLRRNN